MQDKAGFPIGFAGWFRDFGLSFRRLTDRLPHGGFSKVSFDESFCINSAATGNPHRRTKRDCGKCRQQPAGLHRTIPVATYFSGTRSGVFTSKQGLSARSRKASPFFPVPNEENAFVFPPIRIFRTFFRFFLFFHPFTI